MITRAQFRSTYVCNFCGNQRLSGNACAGCGGSSFHQEVRNVASSEPGDQLLTEVIEGNRKLKLITAFFLIAALTSFVFSYNRMQQTTETPAQNSVANKGISTVNQTWGQRLNALNSIPENGYRAYYLRGGPEEFVHQENVTDINLKYKDSREFHGISPRKLAAYWVGKLNVEEKGFYDVTANQNHERVRVLIDGNLINLADERKKTLIELDQGQHLIEVEYRNRDRYADFHMSIQRSNIEYSKAGIQSTLSRHMPEDYKFLYVFQHQSRTSARMTLLNLHKTSGPVVLMLDSYDVINWQVLNPHHVDIRAVVVASYKQGSSVRGEIPPSAMTLQSRDRILRKNSALRTCSCYSGVTQCGGTLLPQIAKAIESFGTGVLSGLTINHKNHTLQVPEIYVNNNSIEREIQSIADQHTECKNSAPTNPADVVPAPARLKTSTVIYTSK